MTQTQVQGEMLPFTAADRRILRLWIARDKRRGDHRMTLDPVWLERVLDALEASEAREAVLLDMLRMQATG